MNKHLHCLHCLHCILDSQHEVSPLAYAKCGKDEREGKLSGIWPNSEACSEFESKDKVDISTEGIKVIL